jgi:hypothetical protein
MLPVALPGAATSALWIHEASLLVDQFLCVSRLEIKYSHGY